MLGVQKTTMVHLWGFRNEIEKKIPLPKFDSLELHFFAHFHALSRDSNITWLFFFLFSLLWNIGTWKRQTGLHGGIKNADRWKKQKKKRKKEFLKFKNRST